MSKLIQYAFDKPKWEHFLKTLKYALYVPLHPFDGFWDLTHEKRGSLAAANFIVFAAVIIEILRVTATNFQFIVYHNEYFNVLFVILSILLPLSLWTVANWGLTTLLDGKGKLSEIYMGTAYAMTPYVITMAILIVVSHFITFEESVFYWFFDTVSVIWFVGLVLSAMMMIHNYTLSKAVLSSLLTIVGIGIMIFIFIMFFSIISDTIAYFVSLYKEIAFRFV